MKARAVATILIMCLSFSMLPLTALGASSGMCGDDAYWTLSNGELKITGSGSMCDYHVSFEYPDPDEVLPPWNAEREEITSVVISDGITNISSCAFAYCWNLTRIEIPESVSSIGKDAFYSCNGLSSITIPGSVSTIEASAFYRCIGLQNVELQNGVTIICESSFYGCLIDEITIPSSVIKIEQNAFSSVSNVNYKGSKEQWKKISIDTPNPALENANVTYISSSSTTTGYADAYADFLENGRYMKYSSDRPSDYTFALAHVDNDTVPELLIFNVGQYHASGVYLYSYINGQIVDLNDSNLGFYGEWGLASIAFGQGCIWDYWMGQGNWVNDYYNYSSGNISLIKNFSGFVGYGDSDPAWYKIDGKDVTSEESAAEMDELQNKYTFTTVGAEDGFEINDYNLSALRNNPSAFIIGSASNPLAELTDVDYLAFSEFAYNNMNDDEKGLTIEQIITQWNLWESDWKNTNIKYRELYGHIANWRLLDYKSESAGTGFYGMSFGCDDAIIICFRGTDRLIGNDGITDILAAAGTDLPQLSHAFAFYNDTIRTYPNREIALTGHSLGGALAEIVSACSNDRAVTFNSAQFLDVAYFYHMKDMCINFAGRDKWNFVDHVNANCPVGTTHLDNKPHYLHAGIEIGIAAHMLENLIVKNADGSLRLTHSGSLIYDISPYWLVGLFNNVRLGTSENDEIYNQGMTTAAMYGGDGSDKIYGSIQTDYLTGGAGNDILDGGLGCDTYVYNKGSGFDTINDCAGIDTLCLVGFDDSDNITAEKEGNYLVYKCNSDPFLRINTYRNFLSISSWKLDIADYDFWDESLDMNRYMVPIRYERHYQISCPVDLEVINNATGETVFHIDGQVQDSYYTDFGNYYVYKNDNGEYVKIADLIEGYSIRILGTDTGTMDVSVMETDGQQVTVTYNAFDVPVTADTITKFDFDRDGEYMLLVDSDGDGQHDDEIPLQLKEDSEANPEPSVTENPEIETTDTVLNFQNRLLMICLALSCGEIVVVVLIAIIILLIAERKKSKGAGLP